MYLLINALEINLIFLKLFFNIVVKISFCGKNAGKKLINKKRNNLYFKLLRFTIFAFGAQNKTRTCTSLRSLVPETSVSTNFTTWAMI